MHDQSSTQDSQRFFAAKVSLIVGALIMIAKFLAYRATGSEAILSDALESIANVAAALMVILTISYTMKPADKDHPYGHGKIEFFSAAFEGGLVAFAALFIIIESISALIYGHQVQNFGVGLMVVTVAGLANFGLGTYLVQRGRALSSIALESSGKHVLSDVWTSVGIIVGLFVVQVTGWVWVDAAIAAIFGVYLAFVGWGIVAAASAGLMDKEAPEVLQTIAAALKPHTQAGIIDIHEMKVIRAGRYHHIDMHVVLPSHWTMDQVHERVTIFEQAAFADYAFDGEMHFHYDPCRQAFCDICDLSDCQFRLQALKSTESTHVAIRQSQSTAELEVLPVPKPKLDS